MTYGTSYFTSLSAAKRYYKPYGYDESDVKRKIREGEIHVGKPVLKAGERLGTTDGGKRYTITTGQNPKRRGARTPMKVYTFRYGKNRVAKYRSSSEEQARKQFELAHPEESHSSLALLPAKVRYNPRTGKVQVFVTPKVAQQVKGGRGRNPKGPATAAYQVYWGYDRPKWAMANGYFRTRKEAEAYAKLSRRRDMSGAKYAVKKVPPPPVDFDWNK